MEANMSQNLKYNRVVENTIIECNRVLNIWEKERKRRFYGSELAMFRGFLSRFVRHEFGHKFGISNTNPYCIVRNNKVAGITMQNIPSNNYSYSSEINGLCDYIKDFDFEDFYKKYKNYEDYLKIKTQLSDLDRISFDDIKNIKF